MPADPTTPSETIRCVKCGYTLYAPDARSRCPECGTSIAYMPHLAQHRRDNRLELVQIVYTMLLVAIILTAAAIPVRSSRPSSFSTHSDMATALGLISFTLALAGIVLASVTRSRGKKRSLLLTSAGYTLVGFFLILP